MTLVVARAEKGRLAIAADTMVSAHGTSLSMQAWVLKSICLPGGICVSYSGSPELAARAFQEFRGRYPQGTSYTVTVAFFEASSSDTNNDYIVAFADTAKLVTIRDGRRMSGLSKTHWIGDKDAYERFRQHKRHRRQYEHGRAVNAALFADEMTGSPASELYSTMRNVLLDRDVPSVGGFVTIVSNRDIGFRFSVYSDVLLDWPVELGENQNLQLTDKFDLRASSGENDRFSISQISPGYYDINAVAFYVLKGRLLVVFYELEGGTTACITFQNIEPDQIATILDQKVGFPFHAMCLVMSARENFSRSLLRAKPDYGVGMSLYCEVNTMPKIPTVS